MIFPKRAGARAGGVGDGSASYQRFVDTGAGNDAYAGTSSATPKKTFAQVLALGTALAGVPVGVARGSVINTDIEITSDNVRIGSYGASASPLPDFNGERVIPPGDFSLTAGQTDVWQATVALPNLAKTGGNGWVDNLAYVQVSSEAAVAGSTYAAPALWASPNWNGTAALIKLKSLTNPATDGKQRSYGYNIPLTINGNGTVLTGLRFRRNGNQDGAVRLVGTDWVIRGCLFEDGQRHFLYTGINGIFEDNACRLGRNDLEPPGTTNALVMNQVSIAGGTLACARNVFESGGRFNLTAYDAHGGDLTVPLAKFTSTDDTFTELAYVAAICATVGVVTRPTFNNTLVGFVAASPTAMNWTVTDGKGTLLKSVELGAGSGVVNLARNTYTVSTLSVGHYRYNTGSLDWGLNITGDHITITDTDQAVFGNSRVIHWTRGAITMYDTTFDHTDGRKLCGPVDYGVYAGFSGGTASYAGDRNKFPYGAAFYLNGTTYPNLAAWQAAGKDTNSTTTAPNTPLASDAFTRADENLETTSWVRTGGAAAQAAVRSNQCACIGVTQTLYTLANMPSPDHYIQFTVASVPATAGPYVVLRAIDANNWVGIRCNGTTWQIGKCVGGTITASVIGSTAVVPAPGQTVVLGMAGDKAWLYVEGQCLLRGVSLGIAGTALAAAVGVGVLPRSTVVNPFIDDFKAGLI